MIKLAENLAAPARGIYEGPGAQAALGEPLAQIRNRYARGWWLAACRRQRGQRARRGSSRFSCPGGRLSQRLDSIGM